jgi:hypothetical protein
VTEIARLTFPDEMGDFCSAISAIEYLRAIGFQQSCRLEPLAPSQPPVAEHLLSQRSQIRAALTGLGYPGLIPYLCDYEKDYDEA